MELSGVYGESNGEMQHIIHGIVIITTLKDQIQHLVELHTLMYGKLDQELIVQQVVLTQLLTIQI